jgi:hypothetical protein
MAPTPGDDLQLRYQSGDYVVADQIRQTLFEIQRLVHSADMTRTILDADEHSPAGGVGAGHQAPQNALWGGEVALELESLPLRTLEQIEQVHKL